MAISIYTAPAGAGKTAYCINLAREAVAGLRAEARVCVPTRLQAEAWRQRLAAAGGAIGVHVLTYDSLVAASLIAAGETYTEINRLVQFHLLRSLIKHRSLSHYDPLKDKPGFVQVMQQLIEELKSAEIDPERFHGAAVQLGGKARLVELADIYADYQHELQRQQWADRVGLSWLALEALSERAPDACRDWPLLIVDGFDDFTPVQLALFRTLAGRVGDFTLTLPQAEQLDFPRHARTRQAVENALGCRAEPLPPQNVGSPNPVLAHLARTVFARSTPERLAQDGVVTLREVPDPAAEVRTALRWLKQQIVAGTLQPSDVALLARDMTPYRQFIDPIAAEFGLPVRQDDGRPLQQCPIIAALLELLRLHLPDGDGRASLARRGVVAAWRSPYFAWETLEPAIEPADADQLDTIARQYRVIRGLDQWRSAFEAAALARPATPEVDDEEGLMPELPAALAAQLSAMFDRFLEVTTPAPDKPTMRGFVGWLERLIGPDPKQTSETATDDSDSLYMVYRAIDGAPTWREDVAALRALKDVLRGLVWAEDVVGSPADLDFAAFFTELFGAISAATYSPFDSASAEAVLAASIVQARGLSFEAVAVLGLGEGSFPATVSEDPFLRDDDRQQLELKAGFNLEPSTRSAEREFFYEAVTRPNRALLLTRSILADNGAEWVPSPYWEAVIDLVEVKPERIPAELPLPPAEVASQAELWESLAHKPDAVALAVSGDPRTWARIQGAAAIWRARHSRHTTPYDGWLSGVAGLAEAYGPDHVWSASRLETYQTCAFMFYTSTVLALQPRLDPTEGLDARQLGHLYHTIFEKVYRQPLPDLDPAAVTALVRRVADPILDRAPETEGFRETPWWALTREEIIGNITRSIVVLEQDDDAFAFLMSEAAFGFRDNPPLVIGEGDGRLALHGFIDRVDRDDDGNIRIIDYKSGGKGSFAKKDFEAGKKLQLPLYGLAAQEALGLGRLTDAFYWHFLKAEASDFRMAGQVEQTIETATAYAQAAVQAIRAGHFRPTPPADGCPSFCPASAFCFHFAPRSW